jgi:hypothetical protein
VLGVRECGQGCRTGSATRSNVRTNLGAVLRVIARPSVMDWMLVFVWVESCVQVPLQPLETSSGLGHVCRCRADMC